MLQAFVDSDCLEVVTPCEDTDPADQTDPRRFVPALSFAREPGPHVDVVLPMLPVSISLHSLMRSYRQKSQ